MSDIETKASTILEKLKERPHIFVAVFEQMNQANVLRPWEKGRYSGFMVRRTLKGNKLILDVGPDGHWNCVHGDGIGGQPGCDTQEGGLEMADEELKKLGYCN